MPLSEPSLPTPKYAKPEIERRWRVVTAALGSLEGKQYRKIEDLYLQQTQLRLRKVAAPGGIVQFKLCKKYGHSGGLAEPVVNLYLSEAEYKVLCQLPGQRVRKRRYSTCGGALDVYSGGEAIFEVEFESQASAESYVPPGFVGDEVTHNEAYSGAALAELSA